MTDSTLKTAVELAQKMQAIRMTGDSLAIVVGIGSVGQLVMNARKQTAQLVYGFQNGAPMSQQLEQLKTVQGSLLGLQAYGAVTDDELESYMKMADTIYNGIN